MKSERLPPKTSSAVLAGILFLITFSILQIWAETLRQTPKLITLSGFLSSLLFFFLLTVTIHECLRVFRLIFNNELIEFVFDEMQAIGNLEQETGWLEVILCLIVACGCALTVHRISVTTCILFSGVLLLWMYLVSNRVYQPTRFAGRTSSKS